MTTRPTRRRFIKTTAALGVGFWAAGGVAPKKSNAAIEEIRFGCIGIDGKGSSDSADAGRNGKVVGICDIDDERLNKAADKFSDAKKYNDYRKMLDEIGKEIDAVTVSTPDHCHAVAAMHAMKMGKHIYCQKPMTHSIHEARTMGELAREKKLITQMGNQGTADNTLRRSAALIKAGVIGNLQEVHVCTNRPVWPQGGVEPKYTDTPAHIHWDEWIGPAKKRKFSDEIHPFKWRGYWDFGTGALGDMACHTLNMSYMAVDLKFPTSVTAKSSGHNGDTYPKWSTIEFEFPAVQDRPAVKMFWYDGNMRPAAELLDGCPNAGNGKPYTSFALVIGEKGKFYSPGDYGGDNDNSGTVIDGKFTPHREIRDPKVEYVRSPGHFEEFAEAIKNGTQAVSNFPDYAGPLTETILLGNLAVWAAGERVEWDAKNLKITSQHEKIDELKKIVHHEYHNGYSL
jgi:predicted dehydrogenase